MTVSRSVAACALAVAVTATLDAQTQPVTRASAIAAAIARGPRLAIARADSIAARAQLALARQYENPTLNLSYTKDAPTYHVGLDIPLDVPWLRSARVDVARADLETATLRYVFERESITHAADTSYTHAVAAAARARLSAATARDADSLLTLARLRRDAGDASDLDVQIALVSAGQLRNAAISDSVDAVTSLLVVQAVMGLAVESVSIGLADTLDAVPAAAAPAAPGTGSTPLQIAAAEQNARSAALGVTLARRRRYGVPSLTLGFDQHDPGGQGNGLLPAIGVAIPLPILNTNRASVEIAQAARDRADAELVLARLETNAAIAEARRDYATAQARSDRSRQLVDAANRAASLSLLAYREGATAISSALEAQRTAREALAQYIDDLAAARNAASRIRLLEQTAAGASANATPIRRNSP
ncbi:MAG TPA: TolC family protein [Gemmatimonadaceae bacterium]|nr:TolC family protein [Gemmatimonadaceae bacterium]